MFPASKFHYSIELEYSVTSEDIWFLTAEYEDNRLMIREILLNNYNDVEEIEKICRRIIETDSNAERIYKEYLEEGKDINWFYLLEKLVDDSRETVASLYEFCEEWPSRNAEYEMSFCEEKDLQVYLVSISV